MNSFAISGTFVLTLASIFGKILGAVYRIPLSNMLGATGIGLYQMAFPFYSFFLSLITGGVSVTLSKNIAKCRAKGNVLQADLQFKLGLNVSLLFGIVVAVFLLVFSYPLASLQGNSDATLGFVAISVGFVFASALGAFRGYYQGHSNMVPTAISQVLEQVFKLIIGLFLASILVKKSIVLGVCGALFGVSISEIITFVFFLIKKKNNTKPVPQKADYFNFFASMTPIGLSNGILPLSSLIDSLLVINLLQVAGFAKDSATILYGVQTGMILPLINIPNVLISSLAVTLIPNISYKLAKNIKIEDELKTIFKTVFIFIIPSMVGMFFISDNIINIVYPALDIYTKNTATILLKFSVFEMFFLCFVGITNAILQSMGKIKFPLFSMSLGIIFKVLLEIILISIAKINIIGLTISSFAGYFIISIINLQKIKKITNFNMDFHSIFVPIFSAVIMGMVLYFFKTVYNASFGILTTFLVVVICMVLYFALLIFFKEINPRFLRNMLQKGGK